MHRRDKAGKMIVVVNVLPDLSGRFMDDPGWRWFEPTGCENLTVSDSANE